MFTKLLLTLLSAFLLLIVNVSGQKRWDAAWESKAVDKWDKTDVKVILENSPWSQFVRAKPSSSTPFFGTVVMDLGFRFTLRSALPVRMALVRGRQIVEGYDTMDPKKQAEFNKADLPILQCALCEKYYIISVTGDSPILQKAALVKNRSHNILLFNEKGEKRTLSNYSPQTGPLTEAMFYFPRFDEKGKPLFTPQNTKLIFSFPVEHDDDNVVTSIRRYELDVRDIVREGQVVF